MIAKALQSRAQSVVRQLLDGVPSGSYLVISHPTTEVGAGPMLQAVQFWNQQGSAEMRLRTRDEIVRFFDGLDLVEPGVVSCSRWRPAPADIGTIKEVTHFCGVARKLSYPVPWPRRSRARQGGGAGCRRGTPDTRVPP
jgi:hypothetical protein